MIKYVDCTVIQGHRGQVSQDEAYRTGKSKLRYPQSKHNSLPSKAVDVAPFPIDWANRERFAYFAGVVKGIALAKGIALRWGGDWNRDGNTKDETFSDMPHFELED